MSLIEHCKREALLQAPGMVERSLQAAIRELEEAQRSSRSVARRMQLDDALAALERHASTLRSEFPRLLLTGIESALQGAAKSESPRRKSDGETVLALLEKDEVARFVEASRLQQNTMPLVERALSELDSLVSSALGLPVVRADLNPFRPEVLCNALMEVLQDLPESDDIRSLWVRHLSTPFANEVRALYESLIELLAAKGVEEARYRVKLSVMGGGAHGGAAGAGERGLGAGMGADAPDGAATGSGAGAAAVHRHALHDTRAGDEVQGERGFVPRMNELSRSRPTVDTGVVHDFLYQSQWIESYDEPLPEGYYAEVKAELARLAARGEPAYDEAAQARELEALRAQDVIERAPRAVRVDAALAPAHWGEFASGQARTRALMEYKAQAQRISQVLGLDAVRLLIEQVAGDGRVLAPVREAFVALEPALLRLALDNPRFFAEDAHPARVLLESIAQRSFRFNDEFEPALEQFMVPVRAAVRTLNAAPAVCAQDFEDERIRLEAVWQREDEEGDAARQRALHSMQFAQERQALADRIALDFSLRPDLVGVPAAVADFLFRDWSLVIAHAQLASSGQGPRLDPGGYLGIVSDLLWSVNAEQAMRQPARLFEVVPGMLQTLRRGLDMLGKEPAETQTVFDVLMRYHEPVLLLRRMRSAQDIEASGLAHVRALLDAIPAGRDDVLTERPVPRKAEQPWLTRLERQAAGFADTEVMDDGFGSGFDTASAETVSGAPATTDRAAEPAPAAADSPVTATSTPARDEPVAAGEADAGEDLETRIRAEVARMRTGDWVDLYVRKVWRRAQLSWTSDNGSLFMFVSQGGQAHGMTRRTCEKLLRQRHLRPVDMDPVVDRALRQLASTARGRSTLDAASGAAADDAQP